MKKRIILSAVTILVSLSSCEFVVNRFAFFPDKEFTIQSDKLPANSEEISITTADGVKIQGIHFRRNDKPGKLIIYFHGNAGNLYNRIDESIMLLNTGRNILLVGYRGYGKSEGSPSETGVYIDGESALTYATEKMGYKLENVCLYGRSLGTTVAVHTAQNKNISSVVLITPVSSGRDMTGFYTGPMLSSLAGDTFDSINKINNIRVPVLIIHGTSDEIVPYVQGKMLYDKFNGIKKLVTVPGGMHNDLEYTHPDLYWNSIFEFMK